jgi:hypothetical protein
VALVPSSPEAKCSPIRSPRDEAAVAAAVFWGTAVRIGGEDTGDRRKRYVEFEVQAVWKGPSQSLFRVHTPRDPLPEWAYHFELGKSYLVYAFLDPGTGVYRTTGCSRTCVADRCMEDLSELGEPAQRVE